MATQTVIEATEAISQVAPQSDPLVTADEQLARLASLPANDPARRVLRDRVIRHCLPAARREAGRYRYTGESMEDLIQVATLGLILAIDRFDPGRGVPFKHYAVPTITGELRRHFRDKGWCVRVSRRVQELYQEVRRAEPALAQQLGRMPTIQDLASHLHLSEADVYAARGGEAVHAPRSLNWPASEDGDATQLADVLGSDDPGIASIADRDALRRALTILPHRLRLIISLRYVDELTQAQIGDKVGISQMHVSRLISRALAMLRNHMSADHPTTLAA